MKSKRVAVSMLGLALLLSSTAQASPTISLIYSATSGTGTPGSNFMALGPGDYCRSPAPPRA